MGAEEHPGQGWRGGVRTMAIAVGGVIACVAIALRDPDAALMTVGFVASIALLRFRRGGIGIAGLTILFALTLFFCAAAAVTNLSHHAGFFADALTSGLAVLSAAGLVCVVANALHAPDGALRSLAVVLGALVIIAVVGSALNAGTTHSSTRGGDITVATQRLRFVPPRIEAQAGHISVALTNRDFFWHTFTISKLHVDLNVATRGGSRITFDAPAGTYTFVCVIHEGAGMKGTLVVREHAQDRA